jgi:hypothetical protein
MHATHAALAGKMTRPLEGEFFMLVSLPFEGFELVAARMIGYI